MGCKELAGLRSERPLRSQVVAVAAVAVAELDIVDRLLVEGIEVAEVHNMVEEPDTATAVEQDAEEVGIVEVAGRMDSEVRP